MSDSQIIKSIMEQIYNISCPILNIGDRVGETGYIDFIDANDFTEPFNKGYDVFGRKFISFRAIIEYEDGNTRETFTTVFQRYRLDEFLWMGAGRNTHLFATDGGTNLSQVRLLLELFEKGTVDVTKDINASCRLLEFNRSYSITELNHNRPNSNLPKRIYLISNQKEKKVVKETEVKEKERLEDVMKDLEEKVNPKSVAEGVAQLSLAVQKDEPSIILSLMQDGAKEFEERVGRPMTYFEMRTMWG